MEELSLHEILSRPTYRTDCARAKAENTCIGCGGFAEEFRGTSSRLEYMVSALCQRCHDQCFSLSEKKRWGDMKVKCIFCGHELNLNHCAFDNYTGSVKCFSCSRMMELRTARGIADSKYPLAIFETKRNSALVKIGD